MNIPNRVHRLDLGTPEAQELSDALERVIEQPSGVAKGNHAYLIYVMKQLFRVNLNKKEAVYGAVYALWREEDILSVDSLDIYIEELKQDIRREQQYMEMAENETL